MLYTFLKFLGWGLLLALVGGVIGWLLRSLKCRSEVARVRATTVDADELERMRHRLANMDQIVAERNRLRMQVADLRHADSPGVVLAPGDTLTESDDTSPDSDPLADINAVAEIDTDTADSAAIEPDDAAGAADVSGDEAESIAEAPADDDSSGSTVSAGFAAVSADSAESGDSEARATSNDGGSLDLDAAAAVLGKSVRLDDLSVIEGIGPKISELCRGIGIETWRQLADTDVATLQSMLDAAGSRFQVHKPGTWPTQAGLLAEGRWAEFKEMIDALDGGR